jgi:hypothetical protein
MLAFIKTLTQDELSIFKRINVSALNRAVTRVDGGQAFTNFKLFEYTSGTVNGIRQEELMPSGRNLSDYVWSPEFTQFLVGTSYTDLHFSVWSRELVKGRRELFLCIKQIEENSD